MKSIILKLLLLSFIIPYYANAQKVRIGEVYYQLNGGEATVVNSGLTGGSIGNAKDYTNEKYIIPESFEYDGLRYTVTEVAAKAFWWSSLKYISLPQTIRKISENDTEYNMYSSDRPGSFYNSGLIRIVIPKQCTSIGKHCFIKASYFRTIIYTSPTPPSGWTATTNTYVPDITLYKSPSVSLNGATIKEIITWSKTDFVYDGNQIELPSYTNNIEDEGYSVQFDLSNITLSNKIGTHSIKIPATFTGNDETFSIDIPFTYNVAGAPLIVSVLDAQREYGDSNPEFFYKIEGFVNGEDESHLQSLPTISTSATQNSNVGTYSIDISGAKSDNYSITYKSGTLTINKAPLTAKVIDSSKEYGASNPNFSLEYEGLKNAETTPTWTISPSYITSATNYSSVGEYEVSATATPRNYELSEIQSGKLTITPAPLTIQANNVSKVYYAENPDLTYSCYGLKNREDKSILSVQPQLTTNATKESEVGSYDITISGASAQNYNITYQNGKMTIQKRTLNVTVGNYERNYGEENPDFSIEYDGFVGSDDLSVIDTEPSPYTSATKDTKVGSYSIYITGGSDNNYSFNYNSGKLTINKAEQDIIWNQDLTNLAIGEQVKLLAESTSGLQITYSLDQNSICEIYDAGKTTYLDCKAEGEIQIRAYQEGNDNFYSTPRTSKKIIVSASTEVKPSLTIKQPDLGAISTKVARGSTYEFTITPEEEWLVHTVSFNGNDYTSKLDKTNTFTTPQITSNSTIIIVYSQSANGIEDISSSNVKIIGTQNGVKVIRAKLGSAVLIYTIDGVLIESEEITSSSQEIKLDNNKLYIIKIGEFTSKVRL